MEIPILTIELFDPLDELPQIFPTPDVRIVDMNPEQPLVSVCDNHTEELRSDVTEVNRGPQGRVS